MPFHSIAVPIYNYNTNSSSSHLNRGKAREREFGDMEGIGIQSSTTSYTSYSMCLCRICHEEEEEKSTTMESPCSCSGTLKVNISTNTKAGLESWVVQSRANFGCPSIQPLVRRGCHLRFRPLASHDSTNSYIPKTLLCLIKILLLLLILAWFFFFFCLQFAHRECIQRWCNEKGSTVCEICLQKFEPGYTVPVKLALIDIAVTIRGSLEVPRLNYESRNQGRVDDESDEEYPECSPASDRGVSICRSIAIIVTLTLLARHFFFVVSTDAGHYPNSLATVFMLRACGVLLPLYFVMRLIAAYQKGRRQHQQYQRDVSATHRAQGEEHEQVAHLTIQIHS